MKVTKELRFERAVYSSIEVSKGGGFKFDRGRNGLHKGVDIRANWGTKVWASEKGRVVFADFVGGSASKGNYGNVIVIDHVPKAGRNDRHIYSLYAHLDHIGVSYHRESVGKGDTIGTTGNSGTTQSYKNAKKDKEDQRGFHLHFEIIDSPMKLTWGPGNFHGSDYRVNPMRSGGYVGGAVTVEYETGEDEAGKFGGRNPFAEPSC
jgi:murein DD-endopeptidase MepM/ murein hydrolase activator NlpD